MRVFSIGSTDFSVDATKSSIRLDVLGNGMLEVNADIHGDEAAFERLADAEDGEWSWALYPPLFFLHGLRVAQGHTGALASGSPEPHATDAAAESGIYMMQYRDIAALHIIELSARRLAMSGLVDFHGRQQPFHVDISRTGQ